MHQRFQTRLETMTAYWVQAIVTILALAAIVIVAVTSSVWSRERERRERERVAALQAQVDALREQLEQYREWSGGLRAGLEEYIEHLKAELDRTRQVLEARESQFELTQDRTRATVAQLEQENELLEQSVERLEQANAEAEILRKAIKSVDVLATDPHSRCPRCTIGRVVEDTGLCRLCGFRVALTRVPAHRAPRPDASPHQEPTGSDQDDKKSA